MKISISEAKNTPVYVVLPAQGKSIKKIDGIRFKTTETVGYFIFQRSLYAHIMESADQTTTPNGVGFRLHIRVNDDGSAELWTWGIRGNHPKLISKHESKEEAEQTRFSFIYQNDFMNDDQRDCSWFETEGEAVFYRNERYAELHGISIHVAASILRKKDLVEKYRNEIAVKPYEKIKTDEANLASGYENILSFIPGERYDDTCARLVKALPERVEATKFHAIVRTLRREWFKTLPPKNQPQTINQ